MTRCRSSTHGERRGSPTAAGEAGGAQTGYADRAKASSGKRTRRLGEAAWFDLTGLFPSIADGIRDSIAPYNIFKFLDYLSF